MQTRFAVRGRRARARVVQLSVPDAQCSAAHRVENRLALVADSFGLHRLITHPTWPPARAPTLQALRALPSGVLRGGAPALKRMPPGWSPGRGRTSPGRRRTEFERSLTGIELRRLAQHRSFTRQGRLQHQEFTLLHLTSRSTDSPVQKHHQHCIGFRPVQRFCRCEPGALGNAGSAPAARLPAAAQTAPPRRRQTPAPCAEPPRLPLPRGGRPPPSRSD